MPGYESPLDGVLQEVKRQGIANEAQLRAALLEPGTQIKVVHGELLRKVDDYPTLAAMWSAELRGSPANVLALFELAFAKGTLWKWGEVVELIDAFEPTMKRITDPGTIEHWGGKLLPLRCSAVWHQRIWERVPQACGQAYSTTPESRVPRNIARYHLVKGNLEQALRFANFALDRDGSYASNWFIHGLVMEARGDAEQTQKDWSKALRLWPDYGPAESAKSGSTKTLEERFASEERYERMAFAAQLGRCYRIYTRLGVPERARACAEAARAVDPGAQAAAEVAQIAEKDRSLAQKEGGKLLAKFPHPVLASIVAMLGADAGDPKTALKLLSDAERQDPVHSGVQRAFVYVCGLEKSDPACSLDRQPRLRTGSARAEVVQHPAYQMDSTNLGYVAPKFSSFSLLPLGEDEFAELANIVPDLENRLPGYRFHLLDRKSMPEDVMRGGQVLFENLLPQLPGEPGVIAIVAEDLTVEGANFVYSNWDAMSGRGVISLSRLRKQSKKQAPLLADELARLARERLLIQITGTTAKMLGLHFPCSAPKCALRFSRSLSELDEKGSELCPEHRAELKRLRQ